jgi:thymidylate synthase
VKQYNDGLQFILDNGTRQSNRTGIDTIMFPTMFMRFDMDEGFPAVTTKKLAFKAALGELVGFLRSARSAATFRELGCKVWDQNANENKAWLENPYRRGEDDLGDVYGVMWREWQGYKVLDLHDERDARIAQTLLWNGWRDVGKFLTDHDQAMIQAHGDEGLTKKRLFVKEIDMLGECIQKLILEPTNRRILFHAWNPAQLDAMALPPCHLLYQFLPNIAKGELSLSMTQRSADFFLGVPFNIASASLLLHIVARLTGFKPKWVNLTFNDAHIYVNHLDQVKEQLSREPRGLPRLAVNPLMMPSYELLAGQTERMFQASLEGYDDRNVKEAVVVKATQALSRIDPEWFKLVGYDPHPALAAPMAV